MRDARELLQGCRLAITLTMSSLRKWDLNLRLVPDIDSWWASKSYTQEYTRAISNALTQQLCTARVVKQTYSQMIATNELALIDIPPVQIFNEDVWAGIKSLDTGTAAGARGPNHLTFVSTSHVCALARISTLPRRLYRQKRVQAGVQHSRCLFSFCTRACKFQSARDFYVQRMELPAMGSSLRSTQQTASTSSRWPSLLRWTHECCSSCRKRPVCTSGMRLRRVSWRVYSRRRFDRCREMLLLVMSANVT